MTDTQLWMEAVQEASYLATDAENHLRRMVTHAKASGATWQRIGDTLKISRQAAQQRFG
jgi:hypothetical protein